MSDVRERLAEAVERGYVIKQPGEVSAWNLFHTWCVRHTQPFVFVDLRRAAQYNSATVGILLFPISEAGMGQRVTPAAQAEAAELLRAFPTAGASPQTALPTITTVAIRHPNVPVERAEELAQALLALYRRMKETDG